MIGALCKRFVRISEQLLYAASNEKDRTKTRAVFANYCVC